VLILGFRNPRLTNKSVKDHFKALDLKNSLSFTLVISQFDQERKIPKKNVGLIFLIILLKDIF